MRSMRKALLWIVSLVLVFGMAVPAFAADTASATTMRLEKTEGTVEVRSSSGKTVTVTEGMRLYSGYSVSTQVNSYAYISLDSTKAIKLDGSSKVEVKQSGKNLELTLLAGNLFFNVSEPLKKDESLNIRTSTMVTGIRGTGGVVAKIDPFTTQLLLFSGKAIVQSREPVTGKKIQRTVNAGQKLTASQKPKEEEGDQALMALEQLKAGEIPGFAATEIKKDPQLQSEIAKQSSLDVVKITDGAELLLKKEQALANEKAKALMELLKSVAAEQVEQVFEDTGKSGGSSRPSTPDPEPDPEPEPEPEPTSIVLDNPKAEELLTALNSETLVDIQVTNAGGSGSDLDTASYTVAQGKTLTIQSGTFTVGADQTLTVEGTLENSANLVISPGAVFLCPGTYQENRTDQVYAMARTAAEIATEATIEPDRVYYLGPLSEMSQWYDRTTVQLLGAESGSMGKEMEPKMAYLSGVTVTLDLNGRTLVMNQSLTISSGGDLTICDSTTKGALTNPSADAIWLQDGALQVNGGTIRSGKGVGISANINGDMQLSYTVAITGGAVEGVDSAIMTDGKYGSVVIGGDAVITRTSEDIGAACAIVQGNITFADGNTVQLRSKNMGVIEFEMYDGKLLETEEYYILMSPRNRAEF